MDRRNYKVIAQHMTSSQRIQKIVQASSEAEVLKMVAAELDTHNYYVAGIYAV